MPPRTFCLDELVYVDSNFTPPTTRANTWTLPPEKYLRVRNSSRFRLVIDCAGYGSGLDTPATITVALRHSAGLLDVTGAFTTVASSTNVVRGSSTIVFALGAEGGENSGWPHGTYLLQVTNTALGDLDWSALRMRAWIELDEAV